MSLARPQFVVLDTATFIKAARDYWSQDSSLRLKARTFVADLRDRSVYISFTLTHVLELLRHDNEAVVRARLSFLRSLPFVAWIRPYSRVWFPGGIPDLLLKELHAVVHDAKRDWRAIVEHVRADLWETGVGSEMFIDNDRLWSVLRKGAQEQQRSEVFVASVIRTDPARIKSLTFGEARRLAERPEAERVSYMQHFQAAMKTQLEQHGDRRLANADYHANSFANDRLREVYHYDSMGGDPLERLLECRGVPRDLVTDNMTVGDIGELAMYVEQLGIFSEDLNPPATITVREVPQDTLPSHVLSNRLARVQQKAERVSGSDLGDGHLATLTLYADAVEVDKRTYEFLRQVRRSDPVLGTLMGRFFRAADYSQIPMLCDG